MPHDRASGTKPAGPCVLMIFGAAGDLTKRLVMPALYNLARGNLLPKEFAIVGFDLADESVDAWKKSLSECSSNLLRDRTATGKWIRKSGRGWLERMSYLKGDLNNPDSYTQLKTKLAEIAESGTGGNYLFYLAIADRFFGTVVEHLAKAGSRARRSTNGGGWSSKSHSATIWLPQRPLTGRY